MLFAMSLKRKVLLSSLALLKAHYRSELIWSEDLLRESKENLNYAYRYKSAAMKLPGLTTKSLSGFDGSLLNDLGTPDAFKDLTFFSGEISGVVSKITSGEDISWEDAKVLDEYFNSWNLLGLLQKDPEAWFKGGLDTDKFDSLVADYDRLRAEALAAKEAGDKAAMGALFSQTDAIRDELKAEGVVIESGPDGSAWRKA
jgi:cysteinyl-tRNA synthetase